ncbi:18732_t:CDS:1 [Dentiscutata erythropus]|uniref:18732_t:CDS:1 n=1 Tax=Dentiscutata erythropus TaxID=1348616 RepID=A0A9N9IMV3_9GLOM|nr:18732_t:CDS:1 [Dentiscutata erythropus]
MLQQSSHIPFNEFFICKCGSDKTNWQKEAHRQEFQPHLWHYDKRHQRSSCPFRRRCDYFKLLQSVDKSFPKNERLINMNKKGSLMKIKKTFRTIKLDYEIYLWVKNLNDTTSSIYKQESELLQKFKKSIFKRAKKKKINISKIKPIVELCLISLNRSPEYHPQFPNFCSV